MVATPQFKTEMSIRYKFYEILHCGQAFTVNTFNFRFTHFNTNEHRKMVEFEIDKVHIGAQYTVCTNGSNRQNQH